MPLFAKVKNCELSSLKIRCLHPPKVFFSIFTKIFYNRGYLPGKMEADFRFDPLLHPRGLILCLL